MEERVSDETVDLRPEIPSALRWLGWSPRPRYRLTRALLIRLLGGVYLVAFLVAWEQIVPLVGRNGLLPAAEHLERVRASLPADASPIVQVPTLFWLDVSDGALAGAAAFGAFLSLLVVLGLTHAAVMLVLWALQLSLVHVGQIFWGYGWEILLLEAGFLAVFLCPVRTFGPLPDSEPSPVVMWLFRWLTFRLMFGAGLIKLRGDRCWSDLTCLEFHYETQPLPNPLSWLLHQAPPWFHASGTLFNHVVELVVPFLLFGPRRLRYVGGALTIAFQGMLILSGNLSFLNWLTVAVAVACFDDQLLERVARRIRARCTALRACSLLRLPVKTGPDARARGESPSPHRAEGRGEARPLPAARSAWVVSSLLAIVVAFASCDPVINLLSPRQAMNRSFDRLHLVNTYGAFGSVGRTRDELVISGTRAADPGPRARWREYELPCKPGDVRRRPCVVAPYQLRLDWQLWFAAFSSIEHEPWLERLVESLLRGEPSVRRLLAHDPFPDRPPRWVKIDLYRYRFTRFGQSEWWARRRLRPYLSPVGSGSTLSSHREP